MKTRVRELRKKHGWTIDQLADVSGVSRGFISQIETGTREPSAKTLASLADAFDVHVSQLLADLNLFARRKLFRLRQCLLCANILP